MIILKILFKKKVTEIRYEPSRGSYGAKVVHICGWFLQFFVYLNKKDYNGKIKPFNEDSLKVENFKDLPNQMLFLLNLWN